MRYPTKEERRETARKKAISRFFAGASFERLLLVTLTTPEEYKGDIHRAWRLFTWRLRKRNLFRRYFAVKEWNERHTCEHLHVVFQTRTELDAWAIRAQWLASLVGSQGAGSGESGEDLPAFVWTRHEWARDRGQMGAYLAKYLAKSIDGHRSYWYSLWWVFPGFARFAKGMWSLGVDRAEKYAWDVRIGCQLPQYHILKYVIMRLHSPFLDKMTGELSIARSIKAMRMAFEPYKLLEREFENGLAMG